MVIAGCSAGNGGIDGQNTTETPDTADTATPDWCQQGETKNWTVPDTGEELTLTLEGTETYDGEELCVGVSDRETTSEIDRMEYWHNENGSYARVVSYDEEGSIVEDFEIEEPESDAEPTDEDGDAEDGSQSDTATDVSQEELCPVGETRLLNESDPDSPRATAERIVEGEEQSYCEWSWTFKGAEGETYRTVAYQYMNPELPVNAGRIIYNPDGSVRSVVGDPPVDVEEN